MTAVIRLALPCTMIIGAAWAGLDLVRIIIQGVT